MRTRGGSRIFFRRGCTRLLLYFNTNKPHSFFLAEYQLCKKTAGHLCTLCTLPIDPPLRTLKECDDGLFLNIYALLKICATIPAMSCECERSASSLRRLHTYNRACMGQERLSSLALMHIHYQAKIVLDEVVNLFATKHPRRLARDYSEGLVPQYFDVQSNLSLRTPL